MKNSDIKSLKHVIISRTDSIGDVMLTLPLCAAIKEKHPHLKISFLCKKYTAEVVRSFSAIDEIVLLEDLENTKNPTAFLINLCADVFIHVFPNKQLAKLVREAKISFRIGTSHRFYHFFNCNIRPSFTRKKSTLHESQLNFALLADFFQLDFPPQKERLNEWITQFQPTPNTPLKEFDFLKKEKYILLHPKSQGSAKEWPIDNYILLAKKLIEKGYYVVFTGTEKDGNAFRVLLKKNAHPFLIDSSGKLALTELFELIRHAKALVACSTGPYHLAGALGIKAIGLFAPKKPIHPGRWHALGSKAVALVFDPSCAACAKGDDCCCIENISVDLVLKQIES